MADEVIKKKVSELESAAALGRTDLLLVQQGNQARSLPAGDLQDYCKQGVAQYETNAKTAAEAAAAAQAKAESAQQAAETAKRAAETAAVDVEAKAEEVARAAAHEASAELETLVSDAETAKQGAEDAQVAAEQAVGSAANHNSAADTARTNAETAAKNAEAAASEASTHRNQALGYSNNAFISANNANIAAERAEDAALRAIGADVNWRATKKIISDTLDLVPAAYIAFTNAYSTFTLDETVLQPGISYVVRWNDQEYICTCHNGDGCYYIGNGELIGESVSNGEPFCIFWYLSASNLNVWKSSDEAETIYLHVYVDNARYEYSKLPEDHLPEFFPYVILRSSTEGSTKLFKLTVDDTGTMRLTEVTD